MAREVGSIITIQIARNLYLLQGSVKTSLLNIGTANRNAVQP